MKLERKWQGRTWGALPTAWPCQTHGAHTEISEGTLPETVSYEVCRLEALRDAQ